MEVMAVAHPRLEVSSHPSQSISVQVGTHTMVQRLPAPNGTSKLAVETAFIFAPKDIEDFSLLVELCDAVRELVFRLCLFPRVRLIFPSI